jgi:hypothetical protein
MSTLRELLRVLPWLILVIVIFWWWGQSDKESQPQTQLTNSVVLTEVESLGKMELVRYNFKEITELTELSKEYFSLFKLGPDQKIALISTGQAVGCIDMTKMTEDDILIEGDTVYVRLPQPEICYYKLDMEKTRIYSLQTNPLKEDGPFIQKAYKLAEQEIRTAAVESGILEQTRVNAELVLTPLFEKISNRKVIFTHDMSNKLTPR